MSRRAFAFLCGSLVLPALAQEPPTPSVPAQEWISRSDAYTHELLDVEFAHSPEEGSQEGLEKFDPLVSDPSLADEQAARREFTAVLARIRTAQTTEADKRVREDQTILLKAIDLQFREQDFADNHEVPFRNASAEVFQGLRVLLDDQMEPRRRTAALERLRKYAGTEPGTHPYTELLKQRELEQIAKPGVI